MCIRDRLVGGGSQNFVHPQLVCNLGRATSLLSLIHIFGLHGLLAVGQTQCQHHLVLPQRDGVDDGGLDLFRHHGVVVLQKADLGAHLQADVAGELQIVELFLKPLAMVGQIAGSL